MSASLVVVVGGANTDVKAVSSAPVVPATSNPGRTTTSPGGVARNIAENLARLGTRTALVAAVGDDSFGTTLLAATAAAGVDVEHVRRSAGPSGSYTALLGHDGELVAAVADMRATDALGPDVVDTAADLIGSAALVVADANLAVPTLARLLRVAGAAGVRVLLDPVSVPKATRVADLVTGLWAVTPNADELAALTGLPTRTDVELMAAAAVLHGRGVDLVWVRRGRDGSLLSTGGTVVVLEAVAAEVVDVTGAGDAMVGAFAHALVGGAEPADAAAYAHAAAALTVASQHTVRPDLSDASVRMLL